MSMRLQVVVDEVELRRFQEAATTEGVTLSEWVRQALRRAEGDRSSVDAAAKLAAVRAARAHSFPAPDIGQMLTEIEAGYGVTPP